MTVVPSVQRTVAQLPYPLLPQPRFPSLATALADYLDRVNADLAGSFQGAPAFPLRGWVPAINVSENEHEYVVTAELPGLTRDEVEVEFEDDILTLRGEKREPTARRGMVRSYHLMERRFGPFARSLAFPQPVDGDAIRASFENGVLTVRLPKQRSKKNAEGHRVPIR